ncbi:Pkinase-domain-containing protein [Laetiporus sulphureus 93-53]|uniref:non-specific serine/threonine protein kinase n=1 Tax=Laetiporus sulphureus 93-53 TaxID=1314785 RepID=A0A165EC85_9APHY|nr:Pkinase-domain-containing protein [Laetiporus sulphureus 93-53]KZT06713.1 Pkinase-domain-containing protein [Laetiporus sulphureus 93-53]
MEAERKLRYPKISGYRLVRKIAGGGFSTVFEAVHLEEQRVAACKMIALTKDTSERERKILDKEMRVHAALKHRNVLEFICAVMVEPDQKTPYHPGLYMLLELAAGGDLFDKIAPDIGIGEDVSQYYFSQLIAGLTYIHGEGVCHRDLKPENLLLDAAGTLKISDFGLCAVYKLKDKGKTRPLSERCGSLPYVAPELNLNGPYAAEPIDVWGCGVILYTMLSGNTPWDEPTKRSYEYAHYISGKCFNEKPWNEFSEDVLSLITGMLAVEPSQRMSLTEISARPWMTRPSQIGKHGLAALAEDLTKALRKTGDLEIATPNVASILSADGEGDVSMTMEPIMHNSHFTQSLMLFSQTQSGQRYTPHLTRFYAQIGPKLLLPLMQEVFTGLKIKWKPAVEVDLESKEDDSEGSEEKKLQMLIGGFDKRNLMFKGWVEIEPFHYRDLDGSFCVMRRDSGNPISWRQLWKSIIRSETIEPHVFRKRQESEVHV